jgi:hypothetical protein
LKFLKKIVKFRFFKTKGKLKMFVTKKSYHFVGLNELILKMYAVLLVCDVFHNLIKESWKKFSDEIKFAK